MSAWPELGYDAVERFVRQVRARHPETRPMYRYELRLFQRFVAERSNAVTEETVIAWIQERSKKLRPITVADRVRKVSRFLDFLVQRGALAANPFTTLRERYGLRRIAPVIRAATQGDPYKALETQRAPVPWASTLGPLMRDHVKLMRSVGFRYTTQENGYLAFDRFLQRRPDLAGQLLRAMIQAWAAETPALEHAWQCSLVGRRLSRAWHRLDPTVEVLKHDRHLCAQLEQQRRRPHIYAQAEVCRALSAARELSTPRSPLLPSTAHMMFVLAYCSGLRIGEIVRLTLHDVHLHEGVLEIRNTKFTSHGVYPWIPVSSPHSENISRPDVELAVRRPILRRSSGTKRGAANIAGARHTRFWLACSVAPGSSRCAGVRALASMTCAMHSSAIGCSAGTARGSIHRLVCPTSRLTWGIRTSTRRSST